jgi:hypothetical protein
MEVSNGTFRSVRILSVVEEHGAGKQLARFRLSPRCSRWFVSSSCLLVALVGFSAWQFGRRGLVFAGVLPLAFTTRLVADIGAAMACGLYALNALKKKIEHPEVRLAPEAPSDRMKTINAPGGISLGPDCDGA